VNFCNIIDTFNFKSFRKFKATYYYNTSIFYAKGANMKLTKLSLAAIIAVGALGTFASATPIEEAIKGVDVSGLVRYRYYYGTEFISSYNGVDSLVGGAGASGDKESYNRFSASLNVLSPIADAFSAGVSVRAEGGMLENERTGGAAVNKPLSTVTGLDKAFFQYSADGLTAKIGKFEIPTPWTESGYNGNRGNGLLALYKVSDELTVAGAYYNQVGDTVTSGSAKLIPFTYDAATDTVDTFDALTAGENDLFALAAIGKAGPVGLQLWAAHNAEIFNTVYGEATLNLNGIYGKAQVNWLKLSENYGDEGGVFYGIEAGYKGKTDDTSFNAIAGYTKSDKDQSIYALDPDNDGFIKFGKQLYYYTTNAIDTQVIFLKGGAAVDKYGVELGVGQADAGGGLEWKPLEAYLTGSYNYAKNFGFELYYSYLDLDDAEVNGKDVNHEIRFQAQYKF
jgi:hypothetical protein